MNNNSKINLLEILKNLRKVDPDSLVLNFVETDNPNLEGANGNNSDSSKTGDEASTPYD